MWAICEYIENKQYYTSGGMFNRMEWGQRLASLFL